MMLREQLAQAQSLAGIGGGVRGGGGAQVSAARGHWDCGPGHVECAQLDLICVGAENKFRTAIIHAVQTPGVWSRAKFAPV